MARSHWIAFGACPAVLAFIVAACGGSSDPEDTNNATDSGTVTDTGTTPPVEDTGTGTPVDAGADTGTPVDVPVDPNAAGGVSDTSINFGVVDCGNTAAAKTFSITNPSTKGSLIFSASLVKGIDSPFSISPSDGKVGPGQRVLITVTPNTIPRGPANSPTSTGLNGQGDQITIVAGTSTDLSVALLQQARGAVLSFNPTGINFNNSPTAAPTAVSQNFGVENDGNVSADLTLTQTGTEFGLGDVGTRTAALTATAQTSIQSIVAFKPPATNTYTGTVAMALANAVPLCADLPAALTLAGKGVTATVGLNPSALLFGTTNCGGIASPKMITLTNFGGTSIKVTSLTFTRGSAYYTFSATPAVNTFIAANNGTSTITITPRAIAQNTAASIDDNFYGATLTIVTQDTNGVETTQSVDINQSAKGVILVRTPASVGFGNTVGRGGVGKVIQTYQNTGNVDVTLNLGNPTFPNYALSTQQVVLGKNGGSAPVTFTFSPDGAVGTAYTDAVTVIRADGTVPICSGTAFSNTALSGNSATPTVVVAPLGTLDFQAVPCGTSTAGKTLTYTNNGPAQHWNVTLKNGAASQFTVSPAEGDVAAGGTTTVTITPKNVPTNVTSMNAITDVLSFSAPSIAATVNTTLSVTPQGAFIQWLNSANGNISAQGLPTAKVSTNTSTTAINAFKNTGTATLSANFGISVTAGSSAFFTLPATTTGIIAANTPSPQFTTTFKPTITGAVTGSLTAVSLTDGVNICNTQATLALTGTGN